MKIKCPYCGSMFDDTLMNCPNCGAASEGVVRTEKKQPLTIEQLQKWYQDRGLPPYETTRFFIGEDHKGPKAFGIYKDETTGNFVVYKNLGNGTRKIRYEGTDEAYAVNELYMRLKEEIIQQKRNAAAKQGRGAAKTAEPKSVKDKLREFVDDHHKLCVGLIVSLLLLIWVFYYVSISPDTGYYHYNGTNYYHAAIGTETDDWYYYDEDEQSWEHTYDALPEDLSRDSTAADFYYTPVWDSATQEGDFDTPVPFDVSEYADQYDTDTDTDKDTGDTWDNDNDDTDYDWDAGDTWDNDTTDWDTDW